MNQNYYLGTKVGQESLDRAKSDVLTSDENLLGVIRGVLYRTVISKRRKRNKQRASARGLLLLTNQRVIFYIPLVLGRFNQIVVPYAQIDTVSSRHGMIGDQLTIHASTQNVDVRSIPKGDGEHMVQLIRDRIAKSKSSVSTAAPPQIDIIDQIEKLGALKEKGLITNEEFENKKEELLRKM